MDNKTQNDIIENFEDRERERERERVESSCRWKILLELDWPSRVLCSEKRYLMYESIKRNENGVDRLDKGRVQWHSWKILGCGRTRDGFHVYVYHDRRRANTELSRWLSESTQTSVCGPRDASVLVKLGTGNYIRENGYTADETHATSGPSLLSPSLFNGIPSRRLYSTFHFCHWSLLFSLRLCRISTFRLR